MTVRRGLSEKTKATTSGKRGFLSVAAFNVLMLTVAAVMLSFIVINTNKIAVDKYTIQLLNEKLSVFNEATANLMVKKNSFDHSARILEFALRQNMEEAKSATHLFENREVAIQR